MELATDRPPTASRDSLRDAALVEGQRRVLELLARGAPLAQTLAALCEIVEARFPVALCSVLLLDADTGTLRHGAGPRLPAPYCNAINGVVIGPTVGSCGTAAYERREVMVEDIASDPLWADYREAALPHGLAACGSVPIFDSQRNVFGTFAIYHTRPGPFEARELELLRDISGLATIAIETANQSAALQASEERFRLVAEQTGQVIYDADLIKGKTVWAGAIEATFGDRPEDFAGLGLAAWSERLHPEDRTRVRAAFQRIGPPASPVEMRLEYRARHHDGSYRHVIHRGVVVTNAMGIATRHYGVIADVTEQRCTATALAQAQKLESLGVLAGGLAHDFNNLLTAMLGNLNLAELSTSRLSPAVAYLKNVEAAVLRAAELTKQMLAYSGRGRFVVKPIDLSDIVREMIHLLSSAFSKKISVRCHLAEHLPAIDADVAQVQQVVMNLVTNAVEAIGEAEGTVIVTTGMCDLEQPDIATTFFPLHVEPGRHVTLEVSDTGCGMSAAVIHKIFDPFFTTKTSGRGLGLSAMLGILRAHRAGITLSSEAGKGSTFTVFFPASAREVEPVQAGPVATAPLPPDGVALVVDDEPSVLFVARQMLHGLGFQTIEAADGVEAVERFREHGATISLVLMDLTMPRMSGKEAFHAIRKLDPSVRIILSSGYSEEEALKSIPGNELTGFLQKPYQLRELEAAVRAAAATTKPHLCE